MPAPRRALRAFLTVAALLAAAVIITIATGYGRARHLVDAQRSVRPAPLTEQSLTRDQLRILLTVEDPRFYDHAGVDFRSPGAGFTTITQGLVKFLYFEKFRKGLSKIPQTLYAIGFNTRISKQEQLNLFLNHVYLGTNQGVEVHGFDEAARTYLKKPVDQLSREEWTRLVAMVIGPDEYHLVRRPQQNAERTRRIQRLLAGSCRPLGWSDVTYEGCR